jgi:hypothetical protein
MRKDHGGGERILFLLFFSCVFLTMILLVRGC